METLLESLFGVVTDGVDGLRLDKQALPRRMEAARRLRDDPAGSYRAERLGATLY
ncbi:hypothetical protein WME73_24440 [Sorangium sp. So ce302]|uniref:hypothetical protein n=1 Tax=Sorangium sp. So ce302 TaxID=3133297 RepID=UPI003F5DA21C